MDIYNQQEVKYDHSYLNDMLTALKSYAVIPDEKIVNIVRHLMSFLNKEMEQQSNLGDAIKFEEQCKFFKFLDTISESQKEMYLSTDIGKERIQYTISCKKEIIKKK